MTAMQSAPTMPAMMNAHRKNEARAAEALVLASRQAIGLFQTLRGLRVRSPLMMCIFCSTQPCSVVVDCASRRRKMIDGKTRRNVRVNVAAT